MPDSRQRIAFNCQHCGAPILRSGRVSFRCGGCRSGILVPAAGGQKKAVRFGGAAVTLRSNNLPTRWGRHPYQAENANDPSLQRFRREVPLDEALRGAHDELAALVQLRHLVREEWFAPRPSAAFLKRCGFWTANRLTRDWFCTHTSRMLVLCATALGIPARVVNVARGVRLHENARGHMVTDVWPNQYQKWVYMDTLFDFHYENARGEPLDWLEARSLFFDKQARGLYVSSLRDREDLPPGRYHLGGQRPGAPVEYYKEKSLKLLWGLFFHGQNYFSCPLENRQVRILRYEDELTKGRRLVGGGKEHYADEPMVMVTRDSLDLYPLLNNAEIQIYRTPQDGEGNGARVYISTVTPNLKRLRYRLDGGAWKTFRVDGFAIPWPGKTRIEAQTENDLGRQGRVSTVQINAG